MSADDRGKFTYVRRKEKKESGGDGKQTSNRIRGTLFMTRRGFGFVSIEGTDDEIYIAPKYLHTALHSDVVEVVRFAGRPGRAGRAKGREDERAEGEVVAILERRITTITGRLEAGRSSFFVVPDDERIPRDIYVSREDALDAKSGDKVVVRLLEWTDEHQNPEGQITEILGNAGDARVEVLSVARTFGLPGAFSPREVEKEAAASAGRSREEELRGRIDCRRITCVTIDPEDAKDFDDAVSYEPLPGGSARLGVHIADVSHYVRPGHRARRRGVCARDERYMVNEVVPMLPERLSNDLCSLRPDVDRLTYSVFMDLESPTGRSEITR